MYSHALRATSTGIAESREARIPMRCAQLPQASPKREVFPCAMHNSHGHRRKREARQFSGAERRGDRA